ncbi:MAG: hypothetical protein IBJ15_02225 [Alphaproteobacteria bacterium]|nr:hypothetical protein [Alphaproteobacteria bacterium]
MLTDVFFRRYSNRPLFESVGPKESAFFMQAYRIVNDQIWKYYGYNGQIDEKVKAIWRNIHDRLSMEIGVKELSPIYYSYQSEWMSKSNTIHGHYEFNTVIENWLTFKFTENLDPDVFVKRRLSFVELAFRIHEEQVNEANAKFPRELNAAEVQSALFKNDDNRTRVPGSRVDSIRAINKNMNSTFEANVREINERLKQAGMPLHYHNGFLQISQDDLVQTEVEQPFWQLVKDAQWKNVSLDMAEALDRRDKGGRDPSFYAAKALESTIKIICELKGWVSGSERGVSDFLNHLENKINGGFIESWERQSIQRFFSDVRNDLGHGPGSKDMPNFTIPQIEQTIEFCMSWIKSLIKRL